MELIRKGQKEVGCDIERKTGNKILSFILTASRHQGLDGSLLGIVEGFKDITERKRMERVCVKSVNGSGGNPPLAKNA